MHRPNFPCGFYLEVGPMKSYPTQIVANQHMRDVRDAKSYPLSCFE